MRAREIRRLREAIEGNPEETGERLMFCGVKVVVFCNSNKLKIK